MFADVVLADLITDPTFLGWVTIASLIVAVVGIIIGYWLYRKGKSRKLITYDITSDTPVVSVSRQVERENITITYRDKKGNREEITDATLVTLTVQNAGTEDVMIWGSHEENVASKEIPIEFEFDNRTVVVLTQVRTTPEEDVIGQTDLDNYLKQPVPTPNRLDLPPCILKKGQSIELAALLKGQGKKITVKGKLFNGDIKDARNIVWGRNRFIGTLFKISAPTALILGLFCGILVVLFPNFSSRPPIWFVIIAVMLIISFILSLFVLYYIGFSAMSKYIDETIIEFFFKKQP